jgi:hypothetical protein|tara:strand:- start:161 stop:322 length:162 start_codon:yes stop_codon:yes gene_type:complete
MEEWYRFGDQSSKQIRNCLLEDMEKLRDKRWEPDDDSIDAHMDYIKELYRRTK